MSTRKQEGFENSSLDEIADKMSSGEANSWVDHWGKTEFLLRQTQFLERQTIATEEASKYSAKMTKYTFWSVFILALSVFLTFLLDLMSLFVK